MKVYLEFRSPKHHTLYDELINYPPEGIEYQVSSGEIYSTRAYKLFSFFYNRFFKKIRPDIGNIYHKLKKEDKNVDLVHVCNTFTPKDTPWVMDIEHVGSFTAYDLRSLKLLKRKIEKELSSKNCKKIMSWSISGKKTIERFLNVKGFKHKIEVVRPAIHPFPRFKKLRNDKDKIKLLFMGSANTLEPSMFYFKGGLHALECFKVLSKKYDVELTIQSVVPEDIKKKYNDLKSLHFSSKIVRQGKNPQDVTLNLYNFYNSFDIIMFPGYILMPIATLEAMASGLPIVATKSWSAAEIIEHERTGFLVEPSKYVPTIDDVPPDWTSNFKNNIMKIDTGLVDRLAEHISILIENDTMRRNMGEHAREKVEKGVLSIEHRNRILKRIYEEAIK